MATTPKLELPPTTNLAGVNDDADSAVEVGADRDQRLLDEKKVLIVAGYFCSSSVVAYRRSNGKKMKF